MNNINAAIAAQGDVWAIQPSCLRGILAIDATHIEPEAAMPRLPKNKGAVAVVPVSGVITQKHGGLLSMLLGGTSTEELGATMAELNANSKIGGIVMDIHSPGGSVFGVGEVATQIREMRGKKPIIAVVNSVAASAAYYIASAADQVVMTPSGQVGSIGVLLTHYDESAADEEAGVKITKIYAGKRKLDSDPSTPLTAEARAEMQKMVDFYYGQFVGAVATGRGMTPQAVRDTEAAMFTGQDAITAGLVDRIATLDEVLSQMVGTSEDTGRRRTASAKIAVESALDPPWSTG